jgi:hypothetical protein
MHILNLFEKIRATNKKSEKIALLSANKDLPYLENVIYFAHSPRMKFYIKTIPAYISSTELTGPDLNFALRLLKDIYERVSTGSEAIRRLTDLLEALLPQDAEIIKLIIGKDLKIGMDSSINEVFPDLIEESPYQGASSYSKSKFLKLFENAKKDDDYPYVVSQIKADGTYRNAILSDGDIILESRQGELSYFPEDIPLYNDLYEIMGMFQNHVVTGELVLSCEPDRPKANGIITSIMKYYQDSETRSDKENLIILKKFEEKHGIMYTYLQALEMHVWDLIPSDDFVNGICTSPYELRFDLISWSITALGLSHVKVVETKHVQTPEQALEHYISAQARGLEGTIVKSASAGWKSGKPTYQVKLKLEMELDLKIVGFKYGTPGTKNEDWISVLELESSCGKLSTAPGGMKEDLMKYVTANMDKLKGTIVSIKCNGTTNTAKGYSTMHPSIVELRFDKKIANSLEECLEIEKSVKTLTK